MALKFPELLPPQRIQLQLLGLLLILPLLPILIAGQTTTAQTADAPVHQYILVFDAGSTGTRLSVFQFQMDALHSTGLRIVSLVEQKITPGLSAYANIPERLRGALKPLMDFAKIAVPASFHQGTTAIVRGTAGLRLLSSDQRRAIVRVVAEVLRRSSFYVPTADNRAVRVISGQEEAEYGWVAVNFLMDTFDKADGDTMGMLDLGGGSTQITFVPKEDNTDDENRVVFKTVRGKSYSLHEHSYLGLGMSQATLYMFGYNNSLQSELQPKMYTSPCLSPAFTGKFSFGTVTINVTGDSSVADLERHRLCSEVARVPLRFVPVHQPPGVKAAKFVAVSSFFYTAKMLQDGGFWDREIPGNGTVNDLADAAVKVCAKPPSSGKYKPYLCMNTLYIVTLLREGYRFSDTQSLLFTESINGYTASWPLGIAIHHLTCHDRANNVCLGSSTAGGFGQPVKRLLTTAVGALFVLVSLRHFFT